MTKKVYLGLIAVLGASFIWFLASRSSTPESEIVSRRSFHWHAKLTIYVKGEKQEIQSNIGLGAIHRPVHTHDDSDEGIIHLEFANLARKKDVALGRFFENWGKDLRSFGANLEMTVNGENNTEYESYAMRDGDEIELQFD